MKICILGFYERLTARAKPYNRLIDLSYLTFFVTFIAVILSTVLECRPFHVYCKFLVITLLLCAKWLTIAIGQMSPNPGGNYISLNGMSVSFYFTNSVT